MLEPVHSKNQSGVLLQACTGAEWNNRSGFPPSVGVWKVAGSKLFLEPLDIHLEATYLLIKWCRKLLFGLSTCRFP